MWIDSHAHLYDLDDSELKETLSVANSNGVGYTISTAINIQSSQKVIQQCASYSELFGAVGISPFDTVTIEDDWEQTLRKLLSLPKVIGLGEIGLDNSNPRYPSLETQIPCFEKQVAIGSELKIPLIIHSRGAEQNVLEICKAAGVQKAIFHCFTGSIEILRKIMDHGYFVSYSGIATFKHGPLDKQISYTPIDQFLIETDTPYLAPVPHRGEKNIPAYIRLVGEYVATIKGIDSKSMQQQLHSNFEAMFKTL